MKPNLDLNLFDGAVSLLKENEYIEYKRNMSEGISKNIHESICAFLNRNGGYIIVGIDDNLEIVGVDTNLSDKFINNTIDSIYSQGIIIYGEGIIMDPFLITFKEHTTLSGKNIFIIDVRTDLEEINSGYRSTYRLKSGDSFFRLNASNYKILATTRLFLFKEVESIKLQRIKEDYKKLEEKYEKNIENFKKLNRDYSELEVEKEKLQILLKKNNRFFGLFRRNLN